MTQHVLVTGAAGFIGSHLVDRLLDDGYQVTGIDNFARGSKENVSAALRREGFRLLQADLADLKDYRRVFADVSRPVGDIWHMAANSDIGAGVADPNVDHRDTFLTTFNTLIIARELGIKRIAFASTSAIYGNNPELLVEDIGPLFPISNYGAMKLASEAIISAAAESFLERAWIFRFPNVIGPRATHGIIYDLMHKLARDRSQLEVLGDGTQQKPYLHVSELIEAMMFATKRAVEPLNYFNIGPEDEGVTVRSIAEAVLRVAAPETPICYTGGSRGWVGDVPKFRYSIEKLGKLGWRPTLRSKQAVERAVAEIYDELRDKVQTSCSS
jgi:UDP-glucose 4-epimerase